MKPTRLEKLYAATLLVIFAGIVLHAPLSVWLGTIWPGSLLLIKSWKEILMLVLALLAVVVVSRRKLWRELAGDWLFRIVLAYVGLHVLLVALVHLGWKAELAGLAIDLRYILFFCLVVVLVRVAPGYQKTMLRIGFIGACIVVGFATLQLFLPPDILAHIGYSKDTIAPYLTVDKNPDFIRVNSTLRGPNPLGAYAAMVVAFLAAAVARGRMRLFERGRIVWLGLFSACTLIALYISYSRSAWLAAVLSVMIVAGVVLYKKVSRFGALLVVSLVAVLVGAVMIGQSNPFISNVVLHEDPVGGSSVSSNEGHIASLAEGLANFWQQPFGAGVGSTGSASLASPAPVIIENQYLFIAHESGWLGLVLFLALFGLVLKRLWRGRQDWLGLGVFVSGIGLAFIGLLLPVWVDDTVSIVWWGLAALIIGGSYGRTTKQKTT